MNHDQATLLDFLSLTDYRYRYAPETLERLNGLVQDKGRTLDVGCGDGTIGLALDGAPVIGFDRSLSDLRSAQQRGLPVVVADASRGIPFATDAFDTVYCVDVLHHLEADWEPLFAELDRVLKPGGRLVIVEPDARSDFAQVSQPPELEPQLARRGYRYDSRAIHVEAEQAVRAVFPLWNRVFKAPFAIALATIYQDRPDKFALIGRKPE